MVPDADHPVSEFRAHRPSAADGETGFDNCSQKGVPAGIRRAVGTVAFCLLKGVVDGDRKGRMRLFGKSVHGLRHAVEEEGLGLLLAAMAIGRGHQFLGFGHGERGKKIGKDWLQRAAQPDVEEIRQVSVADVVVVRWIGGDKLVRRLRSASAHHACASNSTCKCG